MASVARSAAPAEPRSETPHAEIRSEPAVARAPDNRRPALLASPLRVQTALKTSTPGDAAEREADRVARAVVSMPGPASGGHASVRSPVLAARAPAAAPSRPAPTLTAPTVPRQPTPSGVDPQIESRIRGSLGGGTTLSPATRAFLEPRFRANFANVRIHTDANARGLANRLGARAFTFGRDIFFNEGQYDPESRDGLELLAHELTHTIQQNEAVQRKEAPEAVEAPRVEQRTGPQASPLGISDALDYFADAANAIPGYRMFTILIGINPINMSRVEASAANILRAIVEFLPGGNVITRVLDSYGIFDKVGTWIENELRSLGITGAAIRAAIDEFLDSLGWRDIFHLGDVWRRAKRIFTEPIDKILTFARNLFGKILEFVRQAVLAPLARLAEGTRFYPLLKAVLGRDPVTGEPVASGPAEVIGGFMTMIGQEELWQNIQKANAIPRAWAWFKRAMGDLVGLVASIPTRFLDGLRSLEIMDFVVLPRAFQKIGAVLGSFLADFGSWALNTVFDLLKIIMEVVAPGVMPYIYKAGAAFRTIIRDPVRFVRTLVRAAIQGFTQFATNFLTHLQNSLVGWLTGALGGMNIYIPRSLNPIELLKFVLSVLGLTWANIRAKLVRATNETTVVALETGFDIVVTLVREGPAAAWQKILDAIGNLKQMAIDAIMEFVRSKIVQAAVTKLLSMLSPAGALIQAIIAIYNTIMFFIERIRQIAQVAASFIDAIATIAAGTIAPAANRVEQTMAGLLTLVISFLARIAGLGKITDAVTNLINRIRMPIDAALDKVVTWIVGQVKSLGSAVAGGARKTVARVLNWWREKRAVKLADGSSHNLFFKGEGPGARLMLASVEKPISQHLADVVAWKDADEETKARANKARDFSIKVFEPVTSAGAKPTAQQQAAMDALGDKMTEFAGMLRVIVTPDDKSMPAADYIFAGPRRATGEKISNRTGRGGEDSRSGDPPGWALITKQGLTRRNGNWVRMHMVSAAFGGLDVNENLVPAPTAVNTRANKDIEQQVERLVYGAKRAEDVRDKPTLLAGLKGNKAVLWYEATTGGFHPPRAKPKPAIPANSFVSSITLRFGEFEKKGANWVRKAASGTPFSSPIPIPDFSGDYTPALSVAGALEISRQAEISAYYAGEIVNVRKAAGGFSSIADFEKKMKAAAIPQTTELGVAVSKVVTAINDEALKL